MRCPFLREEQVKSCQVAPFRKILFYLGLALAVFAVYTLASVFI